MNRFTRFTRGTVSRVREDRAWITVTSRGMISASGTALTHIGNPTHVFLLYDRTTRQIALQAASAHNSAAYRLRPQSSGKGPSRIVTGATFLAHVGVDAQAAAGRYTPEPVAPDVIAITLPEHAFTRPEDEHDV